MLFYYFYTLLQHYLHNFCINQAENSFILSLSCLVPATFCLFAGGWMIYAGSDILLEE